MSVDRFDTSQIEQPDRGREPEVAELRRRLAFYEEFDRIIQENVARAGDLLRLAAERQAEADRAVVAARHELEAETRRHRAVLTQLLAELHTLRASLDAVESRLTTSLGMDGDADGPGDGRPASFREAVLAPQSAPEDSASGAADRGGAAVAADATASVANPRVPPPPPSKYPGRDDGVTAPPGQAVVIHGVADVSRARSLVEHLRGREGITRVDPREFAGGVLRLAVEGERPIRAEDIQGWESGSIEVAEDARHTLVLRLPAAPTL